MRAWVVHKPGPVEPVASGPLRLTEREVPEPGPGELLVRVRACGVCRTDLHLAEGDLPPRAPDMTPGHEVVGEVVATGPAGPGGGMFRFAPGDRVGAAWLARTDGTCEYCRHGKENLCPASLYTGWDIHGGYAEYLTVADAYAHPLPEGFSDTELAPLLCAGIIGYRALLRAEIPPGGTLGVWGFGGSAHLATQIAIAQGAVVHVFTRGDDARELALSLGAASAQDSYDLSPEPLDSAIIFAPAERGDRRHLPDRYPVPELRPPPVPGADAAQRDGQHPRRRGRLPHPGPASPDQGHHDPLPLRPG